MEDRDLRHILEALLLQMVVGAIQLHLKKSLEPMLWHIGLVRRGVSVRNECIIGGRYLYLLRLMIRERWEVWIYPPEKKDVMTLGEILQIMQGQLVAG